MTTPHAFRVLMVLAIAAWNSQSVRAVDQVGYTLAQATSAFSQRLYQQVSNSNPNLVFSPYSIHSAMSMVSEGARGQTQEEMKYVLGVPNMSDRDLQTAYHNLIVQLNAAQKVTLDTANGVFLNPWFVVEQDFRQEIAATYSAKASTFDSRAPEQQINDYVARETRGMVTEVLEPGTIDDSTLMVLVNTIFFNGTWLEPFDKYETRKRDFFQAANTVKQVEMMHKRSYEVMYKQDFNRKLDVIELPFTDDKFGLFVVLPHETEGLNDLEYTLVANGEGDLFQNMKQTMVEVTIPKFKVETSLSLTKVLEDMGMQRAFGRGQADFSGISQSGSFYIDEVMHKAVIEVTETGTTAAAVTSVMVRNMMLPQRPNLHFQADHPFMYFLRYKPTGHILFQGKYSA